MLLGMPDLPPARAAAVACALSLDGVSADPDDPYTRAEYELAIARGETDQRASEMTRMSGCALIAAAVLRAAGVRCPLLEPPYRTGTAISRLNQMGIDAGAWVKTRGFMPFPGDVVLVGPPEHVFVVLEEPKHVTASSLRFRALDGGLVDRNGYQVARIRQHEWWTPFREDRARVLPAGHWSKRRPVVGWLNLDDLLVKYPGG
jgi:hypothetical protein